MKINLVWLAIMLGTVITIVSLAWGAAAWYQKGFSAVPWAAFRGSLFSAGILAPLALVILVSTWRHPPPPSEE